MNNAEGQTGSWAIWQQEGEAAGMQCLNKHLFYDFVCIMQIPAALCSNDAKSCYNWIVLIIVALCLCRLGALVKATESMISTLAQLHHNVWSAFGNFLQAQGLSKWSDPVMGIGQVNGAGPQIWAAVSMPLFEILCQEGFVAHFICALSCKHWEMARFAFVNDTNLIIMDTLNLIPKKCFWYLMDFQWDRDRWKYKTWGAETGVTDMHPSTDGQHLTIPRLHMAEACCKLGIWHLMEIMKQHSLTSMTSLITGADRWPQQNFPIWQQTLAYGKSFFQNYNICRLQQLSLTANAKPSCNQSCGMGSWH